MIGAPFVIGGIVARRGMSPLRGRLYFLITIYTMMIPAYTVLWKLFRLLANIRRGDVFTAENTKALRVIQWALFAAALICAVSALYYLPFITLAAGCAFMGLILRILKNVFAEAVELKNENDYTI